MLVSKEGYVPFEEIPDFVIHQELVDNIRVEYSENESLEKVHQILNNSMGDKRNLVSEDKFKDLALYITAYWSFIFGNQYDSDGKFQFEEFYVSGGRHKVYSKDGFDWNIHPDWQQRDSDGMWIPKVN